MHTDELLHNVDLDVNSFNFGPIRVLEVICSKVHSWSLAHNVNYDLNDALLLEYVARVVVALHVMQTETKLGTLIQFLVVQDFFYYS